MQDWTNLISGAQCVMRSFSCTPHGEQKRQAQKTKVRTPARPVGNINFCSFLPKQEWQLSILMYFHQTLLQ